jgi:hypothetical protein
MDPYVLTLMEKVFKKGEQCGVLDEETKQMMEMIRTKVRESPRHHKCSSNTDEYLKNLQSRVLDVVENEPNPDKKKTAVAGYAEIAVNKPVLQELCG